MEKKKEGIIKSSPIINIKYVIIIFFAFCSHIHAQNSIYVTDFNSNLYLIDIDNCSYTLIGTIGITTNDIAFNPINSMLYGVLGNSLYLIDTVTAAPTFIGNGNSQINLNALTFSSNGTLYAMGQLNDTLYTIDANSGIITPVGSTGTGLASKGDLEFYRDTLYLASHQNSLIAIDTINPANSNIIGSFSNPHETFGIATTLCPNFLYSTLDSGDIYKHSPSDLLQPSLVCSGLLPTIISGATAAHNIYVPADNIYANGLFFSNDTSLCEGQQLTLNATLFGSSYLWQDGNTNPINTITNQGAYGVQVYDNGCFTSDSINVLFNPLPFIDLGSDTNICNESSFLLNAGAPNATYSWQNNSVDSTLNATQSGLYHVQVTLNNCASRDSINLFFETPLSLDLGIDSLLCEGEILLLNAAAPNSTYIWQNNSTAANFEVSHSGNYWVSVSNSCEEVTDSITLTYVDCELKVLVPNIFSPNKDGFNDLFKPVVNTQDISMSIAIYSRWGTQLFQSNQINEGWNGHTSAGIEVPEGTYFYIIKVETKENINSNHTVYKGTLTLIR